LGIDLYTNFIKKLSFLSLIPAKTILSPYFDGNSKIFLRKSYLDCALPNLILLTLNNGTDYKQKKKSYSNTLDEIYKKIMDDSATYRIMFQIDVPLKILLLTQLNDLFLDYGERILYKNWLKFLFLYHLRKNETDIFNPGLYEINLEGLWITNEENNHDYSSIEIINYYNNYLYNYNQQLGRISLENFMKFIPETVSGSKNIFNEIGNPTDDIIHGEFGSYSPDLSFMDDISDDTFYPRPITDLNDYDLDEDDYPKVEDDYDSYKPDSDSEVPYEDYKHTYYSDDTYEGNEYKYPSEETYSYPEDPSHVRPIIPKKNRKLTDQKTRTVVDYSSSERPIHGEVKIETIKPKSIPKPTTADTFKKSLVYAKNASGQFGQFIKSLTNRVTEIFRTKPPIEPSTDPVPDSDSEKPIDEHELPEEELSSIEDEFDLKLNIRKVDLNQLDYIPYLLESDRILVKGDIERDHAFFLCVLANGDANDKEFLKELDELHNIKLKYEQHTNPIPIIDPRLVRETMIDPFLSQIVLFTTHKPWNALISGINVSDKKYKYELYVYKEYKDLYYSVERLDLDLRHIPCLFNNRSQPISKMKFILREISKDGPIQITIYNTTTYDYFYDFNNLKSLNSNDLWYKPIYSEDEHKYDLSRRLLQHSHMRHIKKDNIINNAYFFAYTFFEWDFIRIKNMDLDNILKLFDPKYIKYNLKMQNETGINIYSKYITSLFNGCITSSDITNRANDFVHDIFMNLAQRLDGLDSKDTKGFITYVLNILKITGGYYAENINETQIYNYFTMSTVDEILKFIFKATTHTLLDYQIVCFLYDPDKDTGIDENFNSSTAPFLSVLIYIVFNSVIRLFKPKNRPNTLDLIKTINTYLGFMRLNPKKIKTIGKSCLYFHFWMQTQDNVVHLNELHHTNINDFKSIYLRSGKSIYFTRIKANFAKSIFKDYSPVAGKEIKDPRQFREVIENAQKQNYIKKYVLNPMDHSYDKKITTELYGNYIKLSIPNVNSYLYENYSVVWYHTKLDFYKKDMILEKNFLDHKTEIIGSKNGKYIKIFFTRSINQTEPNESGYYFAMIYPKNIQESYTNIKFPSIIYAVHIDTIATELDFETSIPNNYKYQKADMFPFKFPDMMKDIDGIMHKNLKM
jgi:hypothetical protein